MPINDDPDDTANILFPSTAPGAQPALDDDDDPPPPQKLKGALEKELFGDQFEESPAMFRTEVAMRDVLREQEDAVATVLGLSQAERQARNRYAVDMVNESGLDPYVMGRLVVSMATEAQLEAARMETAGVEAQEKFAVAEAEQQRLWGEEIRSAMKGLYGVTQAETLASRTKKFIESNAKLNQTLSIAGLSTNPKIFLALAEHVRKHVPRT